MSERDWASRRLHFIGIGGAGMSGLALVCARLGATVTGSDRADSSYMERLRGAGLEPVVGHDAANLPEGAEVVVSTAIGDDNPELALARERGVEPIHRGELLAELCAEKRLIAVAGTHGKTTTTAMAVWALRAIGADPAFFVGGEVPGSARGRRRRQRRLGRGGVGGRRGRRERRQLPAAAARDRRRSPTSRWTTTPAGARSPSCARAFGEFLAPADGVGRAPRTAASTTWPRPSASLGFDADAPGPADLPLAVPGRHNLLNARAALAAIELAGARPRRRRGGAGRLPRGAPAARAARASAAAPAYTTTTPTTRPRSGRRSSALRELGPERLIAVFQPHLYSRTKALGEEFGAALALADEVAVLDVYPAREEPVGELAGVSGLRVAERRRGADGGEAGLVAARAPRRPRALVDSGRASAPRPRSWSRSAPATSSGWARRWWRTEG